MYKFLFLAFFVTSMIIGSISCAKEKVPEKLNPIEVDGIWLRPSKEWPAEPVIGFKDGIRVALWPMNGSPRGVLKVHAPHAFPGKEHPKINFIAIEPIVGGVRCFSELEPSKLDSARGLRMWFSDKRTDAPAPALSWNPTQGVKGKIWEDGKRIETLSVVLHVEKFVNDAHVMVEIVFRSDRPEEVGFKVYPAEDSAPIEQCILTATMGNFARARLLWLNDEVVDSRKIWPRYKEWGFADTDIFPIDRVLKEKDGTLTVAITSNEDNIADVKIDNRFWNYEGKDVTQYWRKYPNSVTDNLHVKVNGRFTYYGTWTEIPGGISYENFELVEDFEPGVESWFGITLKSPRKMGWRTLAY